MITSFEPKDYNLLSAKKSFNATKNRNEEYLPVESSRVHLTPKPGIDGSDYINASWFLGFRKLREYIVTQHPKQSTVTEFWQMVWDHNAQTIVLLSPVEVEESEDSPPEFPVFWPRQTEDTLLGENFKVKCVEEGTLSKDLTVQSLQDDYELTVRIVQSPDPDSLTSDLNTLFTLLDVINKWSQKHQNGPIIVIDKYGGTEASMFCCLATLTKQLEFENQTDVCMYAKLYHNRRPGIWKTVHDYLFLYQALEYVSTNRPKPPPVTTVSISVPPPTSTTPLHPNGYTNGSIGAQINSV